MDPRHESYKEAFLNQLITVINLYITENIDIFVTNKIIQEEIREICQRIYAYVNLKVDVNGVISKKNILSIDTVLFPNIHDPEAQTRLDDDKFVKLIHNILVILNSQSSSDGMLLKNNMQKIINKKIIEK